MKQCQQNTHNRETTCFIVDVTPFIKNRPSEANALNNSWPGSQKDDYHLLSQKQQVVLVNLRNGHNKPNSHGTLKLASSPTCLCGPEDQTTEIAPSQSYKRRCVACQHSPDDHLPLWSRRPNNRDCPFTKSQEKMCGLSALP